MNVVALASAAQCDISGGWQWRQCGVAKSARRQRQRLAFSSWQPVSSLGAKLSAQWRSASSLAYQRG